MFKPNKLVTHTFIIRED